MPASLRRLASAAALAAVAAVGLPAAAHAAGPIKYVAMGDSYSAASGVTPPDPNAAAQCLRSTRNYPHLIAAALGSDTQFTDVTCGGADTTHYRKAQYPGAAPAGAPPQLDALSADTQLVTMTIGGNDSGVFINTIVACATAKATNPLASNPCQQQNGTKFADTIRTKTYPAIVQALNDVKARAPHATIAILTYPHIMPDSGTCVGMPIAAGDTPYVNGIQATLNDAVRRAAAATGTIAVDLDGPSHGHDACQAPGVRWIEPVIGGTNPVVVHPNAFGESEMAKNALRVLGEHGFPPADAPAATTTTQAAAPATPAPAPAPQSGSASSVGTPAPGAVPSPSAIGAAAQGQAAAKITRRLLAGGRLRVACALTGGATLRSCAVTVKGRRGGKLRTLRRATLAPGRTTTVRLGTTRRVSIAAAAVATDGRRFTASRSYARRAR